MQMNLSADSTPTHTAVARKSTINVVARARLAEELFSNRLFNYPHWM